MSKESYARGFCKVAEAHGIDPSSLATYAASMSKQAVDFKSRIANLFKDAPPFSSNWDLLHAKQLDGRLTRDLSQMRTYLKELQKDDPEHPVFWEPVMKNLSELKGVAPLGSPFKTNWDLLKADPKDPRITPQLSEIKSYLTHLHPEHPVMEEPTAKSVGDLMEVAPTNNASQVTATVRK